MREPRFANQKALSRQLTLRLLVLITCAMACVLPGRALSFSLDSIAAWGKFPKFCIDVYRWGDGFFNGYDTTYVEGTGYKFNGKVRTETLLDSYQFYLPDDVRMTMHSKPSTTIGAWLTYLAVSGGYDKNVSKLFGNPEIKSREQFSFGFNCSLFTFNMQFLKNTGGVNITRFGPKGTHFSPNIPFNGLKTKSFGFDAFYFFNHKKYSQAAAFNFSRIQIKSQGSWLAGVSFTNQNFDFDFNDLPIYIVDALPETWTDHKYVANTKNIGIKVGYGYNWVFRPGWLIGISEAPTVGLKIGKINNPDKTSTNVAFSNQFRLSVIWNHREWFAGLITELNTALAYDKDSAFQNNTFNISISAGYRFNLW